MIALVNYRSITTTAVFIGLILGAGMLAPLAIDLLKQHWKEPPPKQMSREAHMDRFYNYEHLVHSERIPLEWDCQIGQPDRVRYTRDACFGEHVVEINLSESGDTGAVQLWTHGQADFADISGNPIDHRYSLASTQANSLRSILADKLPKLPPYSANSSMPKYRSTIEACISGKSYLAIRNFWDNEQFENVANIVATNAGYKLLRKSPGDCM